MIAAIILASGMSKRFGRNKLLEKLGRQRVVEYVIDHAKSAKVDKIFLVYGHSGKEFKDMAKKKEISPIHNPHYEKGQSMSIKASIEKIGKTFDGILFLLGDQPFISKSTINLLVETFEKHPGHIIVPAYNGKRGNPVIFSKKYFEEMKCLTGDKGPRDLIQKYHQKVIYVAIENVLESFDIDTKADFQKALHCQSLNELGGF